MNFKRFLTTFVALLFAGMFFVACSNGTDVYTTTSMEAATKLSPPQLSVAAYPGANVLTWDFVPDAANYKVYRTINNEEVLLTPTPLTTVQYVDTDLQPEKTYVYKVVADTNIETEVSITASSTTKIITSLKKAPEGTSYSGLFDYEAAPNPGAPKLSPDTITYTTKGATPFSTGNLVVTFPVKGYASYTVSLGGQGVANVPGATADVSVVYKSYANDIYAQVAITPVSGGTKDLFVTATPYYTGYEAETFTKSVNIEMLNVGTTSGLAAAWKNETSAKVQFTPAQNTADGTYLNTSDYAVYRAEAVSSGGKISYGVYQKLSPAMTSGTLANGNTVYYFTDTSLNKALAYNYIVVPCKTQNGKEVYGSPVSVTLNAATAAELAGITATITSITAKTTTSATNPPVTTTDANTAVIKFGASGGTATMKYVTYASEALARMATTDDLDGTGAKPITIDGVDNGTVEQKINSGVYYVICIKVEGGSPSTIIRDAWLVSTDGTTLTASRLQ